MWEESCTPGAASHVWLRVLNMCCRNLETGKITVGWRIQERFCDGLEVEG